jgi:IS5 family transposase
MKPKEKRTTGAQPLICNRLEFMIDLDHELVLLAKAIDWEAISREFRPMYCPDNGRPAIPIHLMAGLQLLKIPPNWWPCS